MKYINSELGQYKSLMMIRTAILRCKHLSDLKSIDVAEYIIVGEGCEITSVDLQLDSTGTLTPIGVVIRWHTANDQLPVGYDNKYILCKFSHELLNEWRNLDVFGKMYRLYYEHGCNDTKCCYAVDCTDDEERDWIYIK